MKNELTTQPGLTARHEDGEWSNLERECLAKIKSNLKNIAQFRENSANIGPILKAKFEKNIAVLQSKNANLRKQIENSRATRVANPISKYEKKHL